MPTLSHLVSLGQAAGVEFHFAEFVRQARARHAAWAHGWLNPDRPMHPFLRAELEPILAHTVSAKYRWGIKLPAVPAWIRGRHVARDLRAARVDVLMFWNKTAKTRFALDAMRNGKCIHWEHGAAWHPGRERERRAHFRRMPLALANSHAAARVMQLLWDYSGPIRVCRNGLRPSLTPPAPMRKSFPTRTIRLGAAARLANVKGLPLSLHAVRLLVDRGLDVELAVAGVGPERSRLEALAGVLGIERRVRFHGAVRDMAGFYREIDCLLHPPLTEAFGLVAIEAAAFGCPVVCAAVDGLPEAVADGVSGRNLPPTLPLSDYPRLGGGIDGVPEIVYDPERDALVAPGLVDPAALADAVAEVFADAAAFERSSENGSAHVLRTARFEQHVDDVMVIVAEFAQGSGALAAGRT